MRTLFIEQNTLINTLGQYLEKAEIRTEFLRVDVDFKKLHTKYASYFIDLGQEMELKWDNFLNGSRS